jgi:mannose-1-phosphate guanylyltransferase/mannose-6-phosphate isomerase
MIVPVILCGGSGTRLWPKSRKWFPKQFMPLIDEKSMIQNTVLRLKHLETLTSPLFLTNQDHKFLVMTQMQDIEMDIGKIIVEPEGRSTAPAIAVAAFEAQKDFQDPILLVLPADHFLEGIESFKTAVKYGCEEARKGKLITFGVVPTSPETGYGYIKKGQNISEHVYVVEKFVEKPNKKLAEEYLKSGEFLWNSGMFLFRADSYLKELKEYAPEIYEKAKASWEKGKRDEKFISLERENFLSCPEDSIDYAVMEKTKNAVVIPLKCKWSDVGSWYSLWEISEKDINKNVFKGDVISIDTEGCYIDAQDILVGTIGLKDQVVVVTKDAILVADKGRVQEVKKIVNILKEQKREEAYHHKRVYRPWGSYETLEMGKRYQVKRIVVNPGQILSLQKHFHRSEHWVVVQGTGKVTRDNEEILLSENQYVYLPLGCVHRIENPGKIPLIFIEVQVGSYLGEDDIVRLEDVYGRDKK